MQEPNPWSELHPSKTFRASLIGFGMLTLVTASGLAALGFWQLERAQAKVALIAGIERAVAAPLMPLAQAELTTEGLRFRAVRMSGHFDPARQVLLDNQLRDGRPGVRVYVPFLIDGGSRAVLVDRGWSAWPKRNAAPPQALIGPELTQIEGMLVDPPGAGMRLGSASAMDWPLLLTRIDAREIEHRLGLPLLDLVLEDRQALSAQSIRAGMLPPERHRGYAVQWFALSLAVVVIFLTLTRRALRRKNPKSPNE